MTLPERVERQLYLHTMACADIQLQAVVFCVRQCVIEEHGLGAGGSFPNILCHYELSDGVSPPSIFPHLYLKQSQDQRESSQILYARGLNLIYLQHYLVPQAPLEVVLEH